MRGALRLTAHAAILTVAWVAVLGALVFNSYYLYDGDAPVDF